MVIVNASPGFKLLWNVVKCFLDHATVAKVQVIGSNYQSKLMEMVDERYIYIYIIKPIYDHEYGCVV